MVVYGIEVTYGNRRRDTNRSSTVVSMVRVSVVVVGRGDGGGSHLFMRKGPVRELLMVYVGDLACTMVA